jgi:uncharacterized membrane protein
VSDAWITIILLAIATAFIKAAGPVAVGGREMEPRVAAVVDLLAPALLAGLIVVETVGGDHSIDIDPRLAGVTAAGLLLVTWKRSATLAAIAVAAVVTALLRALL